MRFLILFFFFPFLCAKQLANIFLVIGHDVTGWWGGQAEVKCETKAASNERRHDLISIDSNFNFLHHRYRHHYSTDADCSFWLLFLRPLALILNLTPVSDRQQTNCN